MELSLKYKLDEYFDKEKYLRKALEQIIKDFEMSGLSFYGEFHEAPGYGELLNLVYGNVTDLFQGSSFQLKSLLYRIDISEQAIQKRMLDKDESQIEEVVSQLIIERCMIKVLIKEKYS